MSRPGSDRTRRTILDAARTLLEEQGPQRWTMEDVAERARVTRMTVYRHFSSRSHLLIATVRQVDEHEGSAARFTEVAHCASGLDALEHWVDAWTDYLPRIHPVARALLAARTTDADAAQAWTDRTTALRRSTRRVTQWLHDDGVLARHLTVDTATDLMWALVSVQVWEALVQERHWSPERYRRELTTALRRVLVEEPAAERFGPARRSTVRATDARPPSAR